ncbi:unnamed protein product [Mytilus edulis]|uniref:Uncharacterized protein n=1 Tax=Mytilus edulis TaxID=6550 RepID=A0A8S3V7W7_MYTED|nr:unnamed protein product [Mytilus edulis]
MGAKPKADTPEDLKNWMMEYPMSQGAPKEQKPEPVLICNHIHFRIEPKAGDTTYELWRHEVQCLLKQNYDKMPFECSKKIIKRGSRTCSHEVELNATVKVIIQKLDSIYGSNKYTTPQFKPPNQSDNGSSPISHHHGNSNQFGQQQQNRGGYRVKERKSKIEVEDRITRGGRDNPDRDYQC